MKKFLFYVYSFFALIIGAPTALCGGAIFFAELFDKSPFLFIIFSLPTFIFGLFLLYSVYFLYRIVYPTPSSKRSIDNKETN